MKKLVSMLLCLCMLLPGAAFAAEETHTFTAWGIMQPSSVYDSLEDCLAFKKLEEITGVNLEWECVTEEGHAEKPASGTARCRFPYRQ